MKKIFLTLVAAALALSLCGCELLDELEGFLESKPTEPAQNLNTVLSVLDDTIGGFSLSVHTKDGDLFGPYDLNALPEFENAQGHRVDDPVGLGRYDHWMTVISKDGNVRLTVYVGDEDIFCLERNGQQEYYMDDQGLITRPLRHCFDRLEYTASEIRVQPPFPGAAVALREFASVAYPEYRQKLAPGSIYGFQDYDLLSYDVTESTDATLTGTIVYAALPDAADSLILELGEPLEDDGYEGYMLITETVQLELREDGFWYRTDPIQ